MPVGRSELERQKQKRELGPHGKKGELITEMSKKRKKETKKRVG